MVPKIAIGKPKKAGMRAVQLTMLVAK